MEIRQNHLTLPKRHHIVIWNDAHHHHHKKRKRDQFLLLYKVSPLNRVKSYPNRTYIKDIGFCFHKLKTFVSFKSNASGVRTNIYHLEVVSFLADECQGGRGGMCLDLEHIAFLTMSTGDDHHFGQPHIVDETSRSISVFFLQNSSIFESGPSYYFWFLEHFLPFLEALDFSADLEIRRTRKWQNHILSAKEFCFRLSSPKLNQLTHQPMAR